VSWLDFVETIQHMKLNPIVMSVMLAKSPHTSAKVNLDVLKDLNAKFAANLKSREIKSTEVGRIEVFFYDSVDR
jgi:hypothetical protein